LRKKWPEEKPASTVTSNIFWLSPLY